MLQTIIHNARPLPNIRTGYDLTRGQTQSPFRRGRITTDLSIGYKYKSFSMIDQYGIELKYRSFSKGIHTALQFTHQPIHTTVQTIKSTYHAPYSVLCEISYNHICRGIPLPYADLLATIFCT